MDDALLVEWVTLGERLKEVAPQKFADVMQRLEHVVEAQELITQLTWQLFQISSCSNTRFQG